MSALPIISDSRRAPSGSNPSIAPVPTRVALVNMPFSVADRPSIQCGLLKAGLRRCGHDVDVLYLNLEFAAEFGRRFYRKLADLETRLLLGEWLFSAAAFGYRPNEKAYWEVCPPLEENCQDMGVDFQTVCRYRKEDVPRWVDRWADEIPWGEYSVVGFTTTFEQNNASFALARRIKQRHPDLTIIFGGSNFDGTMGREYVRALPFIDYAVVGEGDRVLPQMVAQIARGRSAEGLPGVVARSNGSLVDGGPAPLLEELDELPDPDYDDYFETLFRLGREKVLDDQAPVLLFETARGCWWGEKAHCTFCGLNANGMKFRSKSPEAAADQLARLAARYKIINFDAVDNIIDSAYLDRLCGPLSEERWDYRIFYEVKANLSPAQLRTMARAGITSIQPGIESLSTHVLKLMRKGVTMIRNVRLLKWAYYYGMQVHWNILTGFPGETEEDYEEQARIMPLLVHLPPPTGCGRIWLERFSPYFFDRSFPLKNVRPQEVYRHIYPEEELDLDEIAYFFAYKLERRLPAETYLRIQALAEAWKSAWKQKQIPILVYQRAPDWMQIVDRRTEEAKAHALRGLEAVVYEYCGESDRSVPAIRKHLAETAGAEASDDEVLESLQKFCDLGLMLTENGRYLSLALPVNKNW